MPTNGRTQPNAGRNDPRRGRQPANRGNAVRGNGSRRTAVPSPGLLRLVGTVAIGTAAVGAEIDRSRLPAPAATPVDFVRDIQPILETACLRCHGPERPKAGYRLDNRADALKAGEAGPRIVSGNSAESRLIHYVARVVPDMEMPPEGRGDPLTAEQIGRLRAWIDQGVAYPEGAAAAAGQSLLTATPRVGWIGVDGNARKFREHNWMTDGFSGGLNDFEWKETRPDGTRIRADGQILGGNEDYRLRLAIERPNLGYVRAGFERFRRWYDDAGGWYATFSTSPFRLNEDLYLDTTRAWIEAGLDRPGVPQIQVGYEFLGRDGTEATTQWGAVTDPASGTTKAIYPAAKDISETVHRIKADIAHTILGIRLEDNFQSEFYDHEAGRRLSQSYSVGSPTPDVVTRDRETYDHFRWVNTFHLEKPLREWLLVSGGYLYSDLDGSAGFNLETFIPSDPTLGPFAGDVATDIVVRQRAHVLNGNAQVGPWADLTLTAGVQAEWLRQEGLGHATVSGFASPLTTDLDRQNTQELLTLRYTGIPFTVVYGSARLEQESLGQYEERTIDDGIADQRDFLRDTDARTDGFDARGGVTVSPWERVALSAGYRRVDRDITYDHLRDTDGSDTPGNGYPAFIRGRDFASEEVEAKLVYRSARWLKTTLKYQVVASEYHTETPPGIDPVTGGPFPGGRLETGNYDAHVVSLAATLTPWRRLILTPSISWAPSRLITPVTGAQGFPEYRGDIVTAIVGATVVVDPLTDLTASYAFSRADFSQSADGGYLPLGIDYDRHALTAGLRRKISDSVTGLLEYGFYAYSEPTSGGAADYTAHGVFASVRVRLR